MSDCQTFRRTDEWASTILEKIHEILFAMDWNELRTGEGAKKRVATFYETLFTTNGPNAARFNGLDENAIIVLLKGDFAERFRLWKDAKGREVTRRERMRFAFEKVRNPCFCALTGTPCTLIMIP